MSESLITSLDKKAIEIWNERLAQGIERQHSVDVILASIEQQITTQLGTEIEILRKMYVK
ncbi:hypothetical protein FHS18_006491 [Paenibacillus phyllosphaerae]|uniref:Uncharacterized protein n=1 Tax=Paenibacillus phyllosphaerae TaxID=274593 RepID=A0A7W5FRC0_9BACL|nr:hypothetical protein [Paenibacillus phyllosphaerae]MBB3114370.1 hypothetical protein [Paenibacillus phyllosphaerae]